MIRSIVGIALYLLIAEGLEFAVLPQCQAHHLLSDSLDFMLDWNLLALAGILGGLVFGRITGVLVALVAAALFGLSQSPGSLGAAAVSFGITAYMGGLLAWPLRMQSPPAQAVSLFFLLLAERWIWTLVRWFFWRSTPIMLDASTFGGVIVTTLLGAALLLLIQRIRRKQIILSEV